MKHSKVTPFSPAKGAAAGSDYCSYFEFVVTTHGTESRERKDAILLVLICTGRDHSKFPDGTYLYETQMSPLRKGALNF